MPRCAPTTTTDPSTAAEKYPLRLVDPSARIVMATLVATVATTSTVRNALPQSRMT